MSTSRMDGARTNMAAVVIGRNEGERLRRCLNSLVGRIEVIVYVDSGSTDGSAELARAVGARVIELDLSIPFTAARARNAGFAALNAHPDIEFVQMLDGDCELRAGWLDVGLMALERDIGLALVFGRRRERWPNRSVYNAMCDDEWDIPIGEAASCGGDALFRASALSSVAGYNEAMIAGEDSELSMRLRKNGWRLARIDAEMTWHDADMRRFGQFWNRARRSGHAYAEMAHLHPDAKWPDWPRSCRSIVIWGSVLPISVLALVLLAFFFHPLWLAVAAAFLALLPLKMIQLALRQRQRGFSVKVAIASGVLLMVGKFAQFLGLSGFHINRLRGRASHIIEYKGHGTV